MGGEERPSARPLGIQLAMNQPGVCSVVSGSGFSGGRTLHTGSACPRRSPRRPAARSVRRTQKAGNVVLCAGNLEVAQLPCRIVDVHARDVELPGGALEARNPELASEAGVCGSWLVSWVGSPFE